jgi:SRSO17 transposase
MRHLLRKAVWDADAVRDDIRAVAVKRLGTADAIPVVDETGDVKKGVHTVGVQRQYTGTAGRIENAQVGVFPTYTTTSGHTLIDRELYLPASWTDDPERCTAAGVPEDTVFATKTALARRMLVRALDGGVTAAWVAGDEVRGASSASRAELENRGVGYVLAVACDHHVPPRSGPVVPVRWSPGCRNGRGSGCPPVPGPRGTASTTGRGSRSRAPRRAAGAPLAAGPP